MKPSLPQGTRDFGAETVRKRNYIFNTIKNVFELYGFQPLETPAMENLETLMGKYGEEGDKLIFKILNNGLDNPSKHEQAKVDFEKVMEGKNVKGITERALRYDLTIPFARYVAMNHGQLSFPFKRYQMQPVWRADRPQKGRYREFYQCDADVVGSNSLLNEVELANIYATVFKQLGIDIEIRINNRKILAALAEICGGADKLTDITVAIDKLDKIGLDKVKEELLQRGLNDKQVSIIEKYLSIDGSNDEKLLQLKTLITENAIGQKGIEELEFIYNFCNQQQSITNLQFDFTLARGLNYYTGTIFEIKALNVQMGSIGGGGRYDDLTGLFDVPNLPGVGISFGVDRIYDVMEELKLFPAEVQTGTQVLFFNLGEAECKKAFGLIQQLRSKGIKCEIYHEQSKFDKQFKYAEKKNIQYAVIIGSKELEENTCVIKDLKKGEQQIIKQEMIEQFEF
ncbi:histidine--tRNA ligase [Panacibacter ginsenosidivorans]|uniref:Histidine--tRNA ligase n=1 Tax=Panacibacter ginsenosidivorans TaxID=1813871 RepID=A0A5B8VDC2_9BACT|nr:histidine--tRNA ligase [Panacibacter ginsenosidivorans]QEC68993.1 histidine--tRNA ligase [Panacibacter ginsenosidivorans]